jgi:hypothetical protein
MLGLNGPQKRKTQASAREFVENQMKTAWGARQQGLFSYILSSNWTT